MAGPREERGRVLQWDAAKGLGFIAPDQGGERLLLRRADLAGRLRFRAPALGEAVRFRRARSGPGRERAVQVQPLLAPPPARAQAAAPPSPRQLASTRLLVIPLFALVLGGIHLAWPLPRPVPLLYSSLSMALFVVYGIDKWSARRGAGRVPEVTLHLLALLGGWPGALLGQQVFAHKISKPAFLRWTWAMTSLNLLLLVGLCTPAWQPWLNWLRG
ncbi:DUF1294 domain-containing protein [Inhella sp.]|uniref:DUF1294 domain-containing protein n=1 Tax=Inhella sp. TaxID=1921806 RepID=UPI0035B3484F